MKNSKVKTLILLHIIILIYSLSGICSKMAAKETFLSIPFCLYYGGVILLLGFYAIAWQQIIKHLPLSTAYANKAVTVIWAMIWGLLFFQESITIGKLAGILLVIIGIVIFAKADHETDNEVEQNG